MNINPAVLIFLYIFLSQNSGGLFQGIGAKGLYFNTFRLEVFIDKLSATLATLDKLSKLNQVGSLTELAGDVMGKQLPKLPSLDGAGSGDIGELMKSIAPMVELLSGDDTSE